MHLHALRSLQTLTTLNLSLNNIGTDGTRHLSEALRVNQVMQLPPITLHLHALRSLQTLTTLNLDDNNIGTDGARHLSEALKVNQVI